MQVIMFSLSFTSFKSSRNEILCAFNLRSNLSNPTDVSIKRLSLGNPFRYEYLSLPPAPIRRNSSGNLSVYNTLRYKFSSRSSKTSATSFNKIMPLCKRCSSTSCFSSIRFSSLSFGESIRWVNKSASSKPIKTLGALTKITRSILRPNDTVTFS